MNRFTGRAWVAVASMAIVVAMAHVADAQREGGRGGRGAGRGGFGRGGGFGLTTVQLATAEEVQAALSLTDEQKDKVGQINDDLRQARRDLFQQGGDPGETQEEMQKLNQEATAKLTDTLDETQNKRLLGILAQVDVGSALNNPTIAKELNVTDEQKQQLADVRESNGRAMMDAFQEMQDQDLSREETQRQVGGASRRSRQEAVRRTDDRPASPVRSARRVSRSKSTCRNSASAADVAAGVVAAATAAEVAAAARVVKAAPRTPAAAIEAHRVSPLRTKTCIEGTNDRLRVTIRSARRCPPFGHSELVIGCFRFPVIQPIYLSTDFADERR